MATSAQLLLEAALDAKALNEVMGRIDIKAPLNSEVVERVLYLRRHFEKQAFRRLSEGDGMVVSVEAKYARSWIAYSRTSSDEPWGVASSKPFHRVRQGAIVAQHSVLGGLAIESEAHGRFWMFEVAYEYIVNIEPVGLILAPQ